MDDLFSTEPRLPSSVKVAQGTALKIEDAPQINGHRLLLEGGELWFTDSFFSKKLSDRLVEYLLESDQFGTGDPFGIGSEEVGLECITFKNVRWKQDYIKLFGKERPLPRLTSWYGDPGASYKYSGIHSDPNPWNEGLLHVKTKIEEATGESFNSVLLNWYRDGTDSLGWHADDEPELGPEPIIASASFGETRDFLFRRKDKPNQGIAFKLRHGSLVIMKGKTQQNWVHSLPKRKNHSSRSRLNLTFRRISRA